MSVIVSKSHRKLIVPADSRMTTLFPSASRLADGRVLLDHVVANTIILRKLGYKVPSPMRLYYDFPRPEGETPFESQLHSAELLSENPRFYNLSDMGTGKTRTALWAWDFLYSTKMCGKLLIVAPLSTLTFTWKAEVFKIFGNKYKVAILHGTKRQRLENLASDADILAINHDGFKVISAEIEKRTDIDTLCIDELSCFRNNSDRSKLMRKAAQRFGIVWGLTGSPMPQSPVDVWAQCKIVRPNSVSKYQKHTRDLLMVQVSQYLWRPRPDAVENAFAMMQSSVRYSLDDVVELPETIYRNIDTELSAQQKKVYKKLKDELVALVAKKTINAANAGVALNKLLQVAGGWVYTQNPQFVRLDGSPRMAALITEIESAAHKVIVFCPWRHMIEGISDIFSRMRVPFDHAVVHGETKDREILFNAFQNTDQYKVLLAHPKTVNLGVTLTAADTIIWAAPTLSNEVYIQSNARIIRTGQRHRQQILHMQATREERHCYKMLAAKELLQDKLLALLEEDTRAKR